MADLKKNIDQHLRSAKGWLTKAEEAFDKEKDIRGELDLMLAQAELQHVKEANRSMRWRYKYIALRHGVALLCAAVMAIGLSGLYWWNHQSESVVPVPLVEKSSLPVESKIPWNSKAEPNPPVLKEPEEKAVVKEDIPPVRKVTTNNVVSQTKKSEPSSQGESSVSVSPDEMQKLVRAAGKSLRGQ
ncbi:hypothetical protein [Pelosinus sp. UFO1]|uniref:hypothetical protein n=1 Tax=Pelosinus sp. UFO1 TaxID=484770 RepID=UPI0004D16361|nr:hypothetical protein [Pelosinus sp. UFO1]AIF53779.1 hypothetical protein UFO1_4236 [Pelosinus sp. UFO1]